MTFADAVIDLDGYRARPHPLAPVAADDRDYCEHSPCPRCGRMGREYRPFVKEIGRTVHGGIINYRFFAVCSSCGDTEEL